MVYVLIDPCDNEIRYVGLTKASLSHRLQGHMQAARSGRQSHVATWLRKLDRMGLRPVITLVQEVQDDGLDAEEYWISYFKSVGCQLTNTFSRGSRPPGPPKGTGRGRVVLPETRAKLSAALKGRVHSPEAIAKMKATRRANAKPLSEEHRAKISAATRGRSRSAEANAKMVATRRANNAEWFPTGFVRVKGTRGD